MMRSNTSPSSDIYLQNKGSQIGPQRDLKMINRIKAKFSLLLKKGFFVTNYERNLYSGTLFSLTNSVSVSPLHYMIDTNKLNPKTMKIKQGKYLKDLGNEKYSVLQTQRKSTNPPRRRAVIFCRGVNAGP